MALTDVLLIPVYMIFRFEIVPFRTKNFTRANIRIDALNWHFGIEMAMYRTGYGTELGLPHRLQTHLIRLQGPHTRF